jgi:hypothetical protein
VTYVLGLDHCASLRPSNGVPSGIAKNFAYGVGTNLDCDGVKTATQNFGIAIIALGCLYSVLSYRPNSPEALPTLCRCHANSWVSSILARSCLIKVRSSRHLRPGRLVSLVVYERLPHGSAEPKHMLEPDLRVEWACGALWSLHMGVVCTRAKCRGVR